MIKKKTKTPHLSLKRQGLRREIPFHSVSVSSTACVYPFSSLSKTIKRGKNPTGSTTVHQGRTQSLPLDYKDSFGYCQGWMQGHDGN